MKNLLFLFAALAIAPVKIFAQQPAPPPSIFVTGMAEMEIVPDEIYMHVAIREFTKDKKKYSIEELETAFLNFVEKTTATPRADVKMDNTDARVIAMKRRQKDALIQKTYEVKFKSNDQVMMLFAASDSLNLTNVSVTRYSHSKIEEYKQQVRMNAMTNAKEKATYMLGAVGQKPGALLNVVEPFPDVRIYDGINDYENNFDRRSIRGNSLVMIAGVSSNAYDFDKAGGDSAAYSSTVTKTIKLKYNVEVTFAITQ
jgi:uncharacterized protein